MRQVPAGDARAPLRGREGGPAGERGEGAGNETTAAGTTKCDATMSDEIKPTEQELACANDAYDNPSVNLHSNPGLAIEAMALIIARHTRVDGKTAQEWKDECLKQIETHGKYVAGEITLEQMCIDRGGFTAAMGTEMAHIMAECFWELLQDKKAVNYLEIQFTPKDRGDKESHRCTVTVRRHEGKTPHEKRVEAESALAVATERAEKAEGIIRQIASTYCGIEVKPVDFRETRNEILEELKRLAVPEESKAAAIK